MAKLLSLVNDFILFPCFPLIIFNIFVIFNKLEGNQMFIISIRYYLFPCIIFLNVSKYFFITDNFSKFQNFVVSPSFDNGYCANLITVYDINQPKGDYHAVSYLKKDGGIKVKYCWNKYIYIKHILDLTSLKEFIFIMI